VGVRKRSRDLKVQRRKVKELKETSEGPGGIPSGLFLIFVFLGKAGLDLSPQEGINVV